MNIKPRKVMVVSSTVRPDEGVRDAIEREEGK